MGGGGPGNFYFHLFEFLCDQLHRYFRLTEGLLFMIQGNVIFLKGEVYGFFHFSKKGHVTCCGVLAFRDVHGQKFS